MKAAAHVYKSLCLFVSPLQGSEGVIIGVVDFWVRLYPPAEPMDTMVERTGGRRTATQRSPVQVSLGWQESSQEVKERGTNSTVLTFKPKSSFSTSS